MVLLILHLRGKGMYKILVVAFVLVVGSPIEGKIFEGFETAYRMPGGVWRDCDIGITDKLSIYPKGEDSPIFEISPVRLVEASYVESKGIDFVSLLSLAAAGYFVYSYYNSYQLEVEDCKRYEPIGLEGCDDIEPPYPEMAAMGGLGAGVFFWRMRSENIPYYLVMDQDNKVVLHIRLDKDFIDSFLREREKYSSLPVEKKRVRKFALRLSPARLGIDVNF